MFMPVKTNSVLTRPYLNFIGQSVYWESVFAHDHPIPDPPVWIVSERINNLDSSINSVEHLSSNKSNFNWVPIGRSLFTGN